MIICRTLYACFSLPGPPLTEEGSIAKLIAHNVTVGLGIEEAWSARNTRFDAALVRTAGIPLK